MKVSTFNAINQLFLNMQCQQNAAHIVYGEIAQAFGKDGESHNEVILQTARQIRDKALTTARKTYEAEMSTGINTLINTNTLKPEISKVSENHHGV